MTNSVFRNLKTITVTDGDNNDLGKPDIINFTGDVTSEVVGGKLKLTVDTTGTGSGSSSDALPGQKGQVLVGPGLNVTNVPSLGSVISTSNAKYIDPASSVITTITDNTNNPYVDIIQELGLSQNYKFIGGHETNGSRVFVLHDESNVFIANSSSYKFNRLALPVGVEVNHVSSFGDNVVVSTDQNVSLYDGDGVLSCVVSNTPSNESKVYASSNLVIVEVADVGLFKIVYQGGSDYTSELVKAAPILASNFLSNNYYFLDNNKLWLYNSVTETPLDMGDIFDSANPPIIPTYGSPEYSEVSYKVVKYNGALVVAILTKNRVVICSTSENFKYITYQDYYENSSDNFTDQYNSTYETYVPVHYSISPTGQVSEITGPKFFDGYLTSELFNKLLNNDSDPGSELGIDINPSDFTMDPTLGLTANKSVLSAAVDDIVWSGDDGTKDLSKYRLFYAGYNNNSSWMWAVQGDKYYGISNKTFSNQEFSVSQEKLGTIVFDTRRGNNTPHYLADSNDPNVIFTSAASHNYVSTIVRVTKNSTEFVAEVVRQSTLNPYTSINTYSGTTNKMSVAHTSKWNAVLMTFTDQPARLLLAVNDGSYNNVTLLTEQKEVPGSNGLDYEIVTAVNPSGRFNDTSVYLHNLSNNKWYLYDVDSNEISLELETIPTSDKLGPGQFAPELTLSRSLSYKFNFSAESYDVVFATNSSITKAGYLTNTVFNTIKSDVMSNLPVASNTKHGLAKIGTSLEVSNGIIEARNTQVRRTSRLKANIPLNVIPSNIAMPQISAVGNIDENDGIYDVSALIIIDAEGGDVCGAIVENNGNFVFVDLPTNGYSPTQTRLLSAKYALLADNRVYNLQTDEISPSTIGGAVYVDQYNDKIFGVTSTITCYNSDFTEDTSFVVPDVITDANTKQWTVVRGSDSVRIFWVDNTNILHMRQLINNNSAPDQTYDLATMLPGLNLEDTLTIHHASDSATNFYISDQEDNRYLVGYYTKTVAKTDIDFPEFFFDNGVLNRPYFVNNTNYEIGNQTTIEYRENDGIYFIINGSASSGYFNTNSLHTIEYLIEEVRIPVASHTVVGKSSIGQTLDISDIGMLDAKLASYSAATSIKVDTYQYAAVMTAPNRVATYNNDGTICVTYDPAELSLGKIYITASEATSFIKYSDITVSHEGSPVNIQSVKFIGPRSIAVMSTTGKIFVSNTGFTDFTYIPNIDWYPNRISATDKLLIWVESDGDVFVSHDFGVTPISVYQYTWSNIFGFKEIITVGSDAYLFFFDQGEAEIYKIPGGSTDYNGTKIFSGRDSLVSRRDDEDQNSLYRATSLYFRMKPTGEVAIYGTGNGLYYVSDARRTKFSDQTNISDFLTRSLSKPKTVGLYSDAITLDAGTPFTPTIVGSDLMYSVPEIFKEGYLTRSLFDQLRSGGSVNDSSILNLKSYYSLPNLTPVGINKDGNLVPIMSTELEINQLVGLVINSDDTTVAKVAGDITGVFSTTVHEFGIKVSNGEGYSYVPESEFVNGGSFDSSDFTIMNMDDDQIIRHLFYPLIAKDGANHIYVSEEKSLDVSIDLQASGGPRIIGEPGRYQVTVVLMSSGGNFSVRHSINTIAAFTNNSYTLEDASFQIAPLTQSDYDDNIIIIKINRTNDASDFEGTSFCTILDTPNAVTSKDYSVAISGSHTVPASSITTIPIGRPFFANDKDSGITSVDNCEVSMPLGTKISNNKVLVDVQRAILNSVSSTNSSKNKFMYINNSSVLN